MNTLSNRGSQQFIKKSSFDLIRNSPSTPSNTSSGSILEKRVSNISNEKIMSMEDVIYTSKMVEKPFFVKMYKIKTNNSNSIDGLDLSHKYPNKSKQRAENLKIEGEIFSDGLPICVPMPVHLKTYKHWETIISFPILISELPLDTILCLTVYDMSVLNDQNALTIIGGTTIRLFTKKGYVRTGKSQWKLFHGEKADGFKTIGKLKKTDVYGEIEKISINPVSNNWLDKLTLKRVQEMKSTRTFEKDALFLNIQLPIFEFPILHDTLSVKGPVQETEWMIIESKSPGEEKEGRIFDEECHQMNPAEEKYTMISMNVSSNASELVPTSQEVKKLLTIMGYPSIYEMSGDEQRLIWKFRYYLRQHPKALVPFLRMIHWEQNEKQANEAKKLLQEWAEPVFEDALVLVSKLFQKVDVVRAYGIDILKKADDETILDILLQLVQAIRYDPEESQSELGTFLVKRSLSNFAIANNLNWYLFVEAQSKKQGEMYRGIRRFLHSQLKKSSKNDHCIDMLLRQDLLVGSLNQLSRDLKVNRDRRENKIVELKKILASHKAPFNWTHILNNPVSNKLEPSALPLPLNHSRCCTSIIPNEATIFKSAKNPLLVTFKDVDGEKLKIIWKHGDDLRQDQLVMQMIRLMNKLLLKNGLDLKLTPYATMATSLDSGMLECVFPSTALSQIIANGDIRKFLEEHNKDKKLDEAMDNFIRSCAGYCVITYILGIGDRHLDNILIKDDGSLFHIDFGYILGHDPKPFAPPVKLCKEMIIAMGGSESKGYQKFKEYCCVAYNILRKSTHLILNLFTLMVDSGIPDLLSETKDPFSKILKVLEKFRLELTEEEAIIYMQSILNESERALFPQITETFHRWAQYWRS